MKELFRMLFGGFGETLAERCCKWGSADAAMAECGAAVVFQVDRIAEHYQVDPLVLRKHLCDLLAQGAGPPHTMGGHVFPTARGVNLIRKHNRWYRRALRWLRRHLLRHRRVSS